MNPEETGSLYSIEGADKKENRKQKEMREIRIRNSRVYGENGAFAEQEIGIREGLFADREGVSGEAEILDADGLMAIPGLVDIHFHGCMGYDFCDGTEEAIRHIAEYEGSQGITTIVPATMTFPEDRLARIMEAAAKYRRTAEEDARESANHPEGIQGQRGASLRGINMEGPFISIEKKGAQNPTYIVPPDSAMFRRLQEEADGLIRFCDIAPETEGALAFIRELKDEVTISLAHTTADYDTARNAFENGARHVTHLFNAMPPFSHRSPGVIGAASERAEVMAELICDGVHVHPSAVRAAFRLFGPERICLVSDSMMATGLTDGAYSLGGQAVTVCGNRATLSDGTIAGSVTNLMDCLRTAVLQMGIPLEEAVRCATINPARAAGIDDVCGSITPGKSADLLLVDKNLEIRMIFRGGRIQDNIGMAL